MAQNPLDKHPKLALGIWAVGTLTVSALAVGATHALADTDSGHELSSTQPTLGATHAIAAAGSRREVTRLDRVSTTHPTLVDRLVVRGDGCLNAEDSIDLKVVEWQPSRDVVVYRCVTP